MFYANDTFNFSDVSKAYIPYVHSNSLLAIRMGASHKISIEMIDELVTWLKLFRAHNVVGISKKKLIDIAGRDQVSKMVRKLVMQVRTELHCVMPEMPFQKDIENWYLNQDVAKQNALIHERFGASESPKRNPSSDTQKYFVKFRSMDSTIKQNLDDALFCVPLGISRLMFPHIGGDVQFSMSTICVERMMAAIVRSSAEEFWTLTVTELIQLLRATRIPRVAGVECGVMKYVHNCVAKILNWRIMQAYDVSAAEDFMKVSFLLSAEDGADIAWSQWNMNEPSPSHRLEIPFGMIHTFIEEGFRDNGIIIAFGMEHDATIVKIAVDVHVARLRSKFVQGLLSFPTQNKLPAIDLTNICTREARDVFIKFFMYDSAPESVSIECAFQLWDVCEWMQVRH